MACQAELYERMNAKISVKDWSTNLPFNYHISYAMPPFRVSSYLLNQN